MAETTAPLTPYEELLSAAPSDESQAEKLERLRAAAEAKEQLEAARQRVRAIVLDFWMPSKIRYIGAVEYRSALPLLPACTGSTSVILV